MRTLFLQVQTVTDSLNTVIQDTPVEKEFSLWELVTSGGIGGILIMAILGLLSILAVYIFFERFMAINKAAKTDEHFMNQIKDFIHTGKIDSAKSLCLATKHPVARMIEKGIARIGKPLGDISAAVENVGKLELYRLEKNLASLATIAGAAPMIGFLGTVIGMIIAIHDLAQGDGNVDVKVLSEGIYTAMVTTVGGLIVGIMAYVGYNLLVARVEKVIYLMEAKTTEFLDILQEPAK